MIYFFMESDEGTSKLRGSLLKVLDSGDAPSTKLRGDLLTKLRESTTDESSVEAPSQPHDMVIGAKIVQRDSGETFEIVGIDETRNVVLLKAEAGHTVTLALPDLQLKLETEGSPWHW
jgi:hypothetical protein